LLVPRTGISGEGAVEQVDVFLTCNTCGVEIVLSPDLVIRAAEITTFVDAHAHPESGGRTSIALSAPLPEEPRDAGEEPA